ncbi:9209_t:CDS:2, partial [Cetraspora pellucida]
MPKGRPHKNISLCAVCGNNDLQERFHVLMPVLLTKVKQNINILGDEIYLSQENYKYLIKKILNVKQPKREISELSINSYIRNKNTEIKQFSEYFSDQQVSSAKTALGLFLAKSGASAHCVNTITNIGLYITYQTAFNRINGISNKHRISEKKYIQAHVNDYHNLHGTHIPSTNFAQQIVHYATILFNTIKCLPIPYNSVYGFPIHNHQGLIENLTIHSYNADIIEKYHQNFNQTKLIDCIELDLKNTKNYIEAVKTFLSLSEVIKYLMNYVIPLLADFPGWLLVKKYITKSFETSKDIVYITFLDLLDNLIPATLDIYMHLFLFLSDIQYWKITEHPIINILKTHLNAFDEYPIENFHSLLQCHTSAKVTIGMSLRRDAIFLDHCRHENAFVTSFEAKRDYPYTEKDLDNL